MGRQYGLALTALTARGKGNAAVMDNLSHILTLVGCQSVRS
jgi:hypothetical protein